MPPSAAKCKWRLRAAHALHPCVVGTLAQIAALIGGVRTSSGVFWDAADLPLLPGFGVFDQFTSEIALVSWK